MNDDAFDDKVDTKVDPKSPRSTISVRKAADEHAAAAPRAPSFGKRGVPARRQTVAAAGSAKPVNPAAPGRSPRDSARDSARDARRDPQAAAPRPPQVRPVASNDDEPRLSKLMAERGICSRREADEWIESGWVKVDGVVRSELGTRVARDVVIDVDPAARKSQAARVTVLLNKPIGYVSGQAEDGHAPAITLVLPDNRWVEDTLPTRFLRGHLLGLAPAGRLDIDSTGLLVLTQDGRIARKLIGEDSDVEKEYLVRVEGKLDAAGMALLNHGMSLDGQVLKPAKVSWQNEDQLRFVLREGKKRQIRRMCEMVGLTVVGLRRVRIGSVVLGKLPVGSWRYLRPDEKF